MMQPTTPLSTLFLRCLYAPYRRVGHHANYATHVAGDHLTVFFQDSDGAADWFHNLAFPAKPYRRMGKTAWYAHRGFLRVWKSVEPILAPTLRDPAVRRVTVVGYSHGAALAILCHEYIWFHRPDLREHMEGIGFGAPRVLWGNPPAHVRARWQHFTVVRNIDDAVTHLPPAFLGYLHVGTLIEIGEAGKYTPIDAHRSQNILRELIAKEQTAPAAPATPKISSVS